MSETPPERPWYADVVAPALLHTARRTYGKAIRARLEAAGFTDMPRAGARLVGGIARNGPSVGETAAQLGVSKQAASQLVDALVERGYIVRHGDAGDRRRVVLDLTERGRVAAREIRAVVDDIDARWVERVGADRVAITREALGALVALDEPHDG